MYEYPKLYPQNTHIVLLMVQTDNITGAAMIYYLWCVGVVFI